MAFLGLTYVRLEDFADRPFFATVNGYAYSRANYKLSWRMVPVTLRLVVDEFRIPAAGGAARLQAAIRPVRHVDLGDAATQCTHRREAARLRRQPRSGDRPCQRNPIAGRLLQDGAGHHLGMSYNDPGMDAAILPGTRPGYRRRRGPGARIDRRTRVRYTGSAGYGRGEPAHPPRPVRNRRRRSRIGNTGAWHLDISHTLETDPSVRHLYYRPTTATMVRATNTKSGNRKAGCRNGLSQADPRSRSAWRGGPGPPRASPRVAAAKTGGEMSIFVYLGSSGNVHSS